MKVRIKSLIKAQIYILLIVGMQEIINKTPLTKEKMLRKLLLEAIKKRQKELCYWMLKAKG